jgi:hypothetical protein
MVREHVGAILSAARRLVQSFLRWLVQYFLCWSVQCPLALVGVEAPVMGIRNGPYREDVPVGTIVRIRDRGFLEAFCKEWRLHNPLVPEQVRYGGQRAVVKDVGFYHGGDELYSYSLDGVPGIWHERCLEPADV